MRMNGGRGQSYILNPISIGEGGGGGVKIGYATQNLVTSATVHTIITLL